MAPVTRRTGYERTPDAMAALLLGRLAVDRRYAGRGVGTAVVAYVLATAADLNARAAAEDDPSVRRA